MSNPALRIRLIERSIRCFVLGWLGLIPLVGLGPALLAIWLYSDIWSESWEEWNPASRYVFAGYCLGWLGVLGTIATVALFILWLIKEYGV